MSYHKSCGFPWSWKICLKPDLKTICLFVIAALLGECVSIIKCSFTKIHQFHTILSRKASRQPWGTMASLILNMAVWSSNEVDYQKGLSHLWIYNSKFRLRLQLSFIPKYIPSISHTDSMSLKSRVSHLLLASPHQCNAIQWNAVQSKPFHLAAAAVNLSPPTIGENLDIGIHI